MSQSETARAHGAGWMSATALTAAMLLLSGCALTPKGTAEEKTKLDEAGARYEPPIDKRELPELPAQPTWREILSRAFLANGEVEAAYFQWKSAVEGVRVAGAWPNTDVNLGYSYMFSSENVKTFDRMTFTAGFDAMENLAWPTKTKQAAKVALAEARAASERFRVVKFEVQRKVLSAWADYELQDRVIRLMREDLALRQMLTEAASRRSQTGGRQRDVLETQLALRMAESALHDMEAEHDSTRVLINGLLGRDAGAPLAVAAVPAPLRPVPGDDAQLLAAAVEMFPEVATLTREMESRADALELARMGWIPDVNPSVFFTGSVAQAIGFGIVLPTTIAEIQGQIEQARAGLRASEATLRQGRFDRLGEYVQLLIMLRNAQRRSDFFEQDIQPLAKRLSDQHQLAYEIGAAEWDEFIEGRRTLLEVQVTVAQARAVIEKALVEIECCLGLDIETLPATQPDVPPVQVRADSHHELFAGGEQ